MSFHGSWDRTPPTGYKVIYIPWKGGDPIAAADTQSGYQNLLYTEAVESEPNNSCPNGCTRYIPLLSHPANCRPVGLAFDGRGRLYVSSDASGEIFRVRYTNGSSKSTSGSQSLGPRNSLSAWILAFVVGIMVLGLI